MFAPGAYFWFDRGDDNSIPETVQRWSDSFHLRATSDEVNLENQLDTRYLSAFGLCGAIFSYGLPILLFPVIGGLISTFAGEHGEPIADVFFTVGLGLISYLIGLIVPVTIKTMALQREARRYSRLRYSEKDGYRPASWSIPSNVDLVLAIPGFLLFASIWWGR